MIRFRYSLILLTILSLLATGCQDDEPRPDPALTAVLRQLEYPTTVRNELAKGQLLGSCAQRTLVDTRPDPVRFITLTAHPKNRRVQRAEWEATGRVRGFAVGQHNRYDLFYRSDGLIDSVVYSRPRRGDEGKQTYRYHYQGGVLHSVQADETSPFFHEWYFSYQPDGRVSDMFTNFSPRSGASPRSFTQWSFTYDTSGNVTELRTIGDHRLDSLYQYTYDTLANPFRGLFVIKDLVVFPFAIKLGPAFLSVNNVTSVIKIRKDGRREEETYVPFTGPPGSEAFYSLSYYCR